MKGYLYIVTCTPAEEAARIHGIQYSGGYDISSQTVDGKVVIRYYSCAPPSFFKTR